MKEANVCTADYYSVPFHFWETVRNWPQQWPTQGMGKMGIYSSLLLMNAITGRINSPSISGEPFPLLGSRDRPLQIHRSLQLELNNKLRWDSQSQGEWVGHSLPYLLLLCSKTGIETLLYFTGLWPRNGEISPFPLVRNYSIQFANILFEMEAHLTPTPHRRI